jgi:hypothetical protein
MSPAMRRVIASFSACTSRTSSIARKRAGIAGSPLALQQLPLGQHLVPEQRRKKEAGRDRLAFLDATIGSLQGQHDEAFAERLIENHVEQWQQAVVQPFLAQPCDAAHGVPGGEQLEHLVEQARRRHVLDQVGHLADRPPCRRVDRRPSLAARRTARSMRTGSSR